MKILSLFSILFLCNGCILMRYQFEKAINNLPPCSKLISVGNYSIRYELNNVTYKARYWSNGEIYKTEVIYQ